MAEEPERLPDGADTELDGDAGRTTAARAAGRAARTVARWRSTSRPASSTIDRYVVVEDCGLPVNPAIVEGQIRGGVAQGIGAVLLRALGLRRGRAVPGVDVHGLPDADDDGRAELRDPPRRDRSLTDPDVNFRGVGEGGMIVAPACITNAIEDALAPLGVKVREQHLPPSRILSLARDGAGMKTPAFEYHAPRTVDEVVALLAEHADEAKVLAGGQSLVPLLAMRLARPTQLVDINEVDELAGIRPINGTGVTIGALTRERMRSIRRSSPRGHRCSPRRCRSSATSRSATAEPSAARSRTPTRRRSCPRSRSSRARRWSCVPCRASGSWRPTTSSSGTSRRRWPTTSC